MGRRVKRSPRDPPARRAFAERVAGFPDWAHLWLVGLAQASWPPVPEPNPLLPPLAVQRRAGVSALALDDEWEGAGRHGARRWRDASR